MYPLDAVFDTYDDVPEDIRTNKRYAGNENWTVAECAKEVEKDFNKIDILVLPWQRPRGAEAPPRDLPQRLPRGPLRFFLL